MACSKSVFQRPSVILLGLILVSCGTSFLVQGNPLPQDSSKSVESHVNDAVKAADDFITRTSNTFSGKADPNTPGGLSHWELAGIIAAAIVIGFVAFCCIGYCLCECVKELICCICCCKCCRD